LLDKSCSNKDFQNGKARDMRAMMRIKLSKEWWAL